MSIFISASDYHSLQLDEVCGFIEELIGYKPTDIILRVTPKGIKVEILE